MNYTDEQRAILAQYEPYLRTAARSDWARNPGPRALEQINDILYAGKPHKPRVNYGCQQCILSILRDAGRAYFADLEEIERLKGEAGRITPDGLPSADIAKAAKKAENKAVKPAGGKTPGRTRKAAKTEK